MGNYKNKTDSPIINYADETLSDDSILDDEHDFKLDDFVLDDNYDSKLNELISSSNIMFYFTSNQYRTTSPRVIETTNKQIDHLDQFSNGFENPFENRNTVDCYQYL